MSTWHSDLSINLQIDLMARQSSPQRRMKPMSIIEHLSLKRRKMTQKKANPKCWLSMHKNKIPPQNYNVGIKSRTKVVI